MSIRAVSATGGELLFETVDELLEYERKAGVGREPIHARPVSPDLIDEVRRSVSLLELARERVQLVPRGKCHVGTCPFHACGAEKDFHVHEERGFFYCFACQASGNVISFVQSIEGIGFVEAVQMLAARKPRAEA